MHMLTMRDWVLKPPRLSRARGSYFGGQAFEKGCLSSATVQYQFRRSFRTSAIVYLRTLLCCHLPNAVLPK